MCKRVWVWLLLATLAGGVPEERQYCSARYRRLCLGKGAHVACQYPESGPGEFCENYTKIVFKNDLKHFITNYINRRRQRVASGSERVRGGAHLPKPQVMMLVAWDRELARLAQRLADQCQFVHDQCRATVKYPFAGQTVGEVRWRRSSDSEDISAQRAIRRVFDAWWGERRRALVKDVISPFKLSAKGTVWGHFSQLAVWNLQAVGCGAVRHGTRYPRLLLVCDFSHTNMLGQKTIVPGPTAHCPANMARRGRSAYPALCGPYRSPSHEEKELVEYDDDEDDSEDIETTEAVLTRVKQTKEVTTYRPTTSPPICATWTTKQTFIRTSEVTRRTKAVNQAVKKLWEDYKTTDVDTDMQKEIEMDIAKSIMRDIDTEIKHFRKIKEKSEPNDEGNDNEELYFKGKERPTTVYVTKKQKLNKYRWQLRERDNSRDSLDKTRDERPHNDRDNLDLVETDISQQIVHFAEGERNRPVVKQDKIEKKTSESTDWPVKVQLVSSPLSRPRTNTEEPSGESETRDTEQEAEPRLSWKYTRHRPQRPGANGLSFTTIYKSSTASIVNTNLKMDKEDIEQLFRDTGFKLDWRKQTT